MSIYRFIKYNKRKRLTIAIYALTALYNVELKIFPPSILQRKWGTIDKESKEDETFDHYMYAYTISQYLDRIANKTRWSSKCLVRALTARRLLARKGISCTIYLGTTLGDNSKLVAHAWVRSGKCFVTGGRGEEYITVARFATE